MQSLVDDDLVHQDKIGISNFFWQADGAVYRLGLHPCRSCDSWPAAEQCLVTCRSFPSEAVVKVSIGCPVVLFSSLNSMPAEY